jgi:TPR repeat protein
VSFLKFTVVCVAALVICGCDWGQPTFLSPRPDKQAVSAVTDLGKDRRQFWRADSAATKKDAESGDAEAQNNLGVMYYKGLGVPEDYAEAVKWYRLAADQGDAEAQFNLGVMYHDGRGVSQDYAEAVKWYRLAADQGDAEAQGNLGVMYHDGRGVPQDYGEAYAWFSVAAAFGDANAANNRDIVAGELTRDQLWPWQKRATELFEKISGGK